MNDHVWSLSPLFASVFFERKIDLLLYFCRLEPLQGLVAQWVGRWNTWTPVLLWCGAFLSTTTFTTPTLLWAWFSTAASFPPPTIGSIKCITAKRGPTREGPVVRLSLTRTRPLSWSLTWKVQRIIQCSMYQWYHRSGTSWHPKSGRDCTRWNGRATPVEPLPSGRRVRRPASGGREPLSSPQCL